MPDTAEQANSTSAVHNHPLRALFLADLGPVPARVIWAWRERGHDIAEIWTASPRRRGPWRRDRTLGYFAPRWSLSAAFRRFKIRHRIVSDLKAHSEIADLISSLTVDVVVSVHFKLILPRGLLSRLTMPVLNLHPSLLPAYRGPSPMASMIIDEMQDRYGGVTLHAIVPGIDTGPIFASRKAPLPNSKSLRQWELDLARAAAGLAVEAIPDIVAGHLIGLEQDRSQASYRRATADQFVLTSAQTSARIAWLCSTLGTVTPMRFKTPTASYPVTGIARVLGPPSGEPPRPGWLTVDADVADARLRLRRTALWEGRRRRLDAWIRKVLSQR